MASDSRLSLATQVPDVGASFSNTLLNLGRINQLQQSRAEQPFRNRILDAQAQTTEAAVPTALDRLNKEDKNRLTSVVNFASRINGLPPEQQLTIAKARRSQLIDNALSSGTTANTEDTDVIISRLESKDFTGAQQLIDTSVNAGQQFGIITTPSVIKPAIKEGLTQDGERAFFAVTPTGATQIPGAIPAEKTPLVQMFGTKEEQKELAKLRAQDLKVIRAKAAEAEQQISSLDILDNIDVRTGAAEPMKQAIAGFAEAFGVNADSLANVAAGQAFTSEAGKVVLRVMETQKGPQTDNDRKNIAKTISRLGNRPEANRFINNSARAIAKRSIDQRDFFNNYLDKNDTLKGASSAWNKVKRDVPMVSRFVLTPEGLPVFFFRFEERVLEANPGASKDEIINAWSQQEQAAKAARK